MIAYQTKEENGKNIIHEVSRMRFSVVIDSFIIDNISNFHCLKNKKYFDEKMKVVFIIFPYDWLKSV